MIEIISRTIVALMSGFILSTAYEKDDWVTIIHTLILFIAFLVYIEVR